MAINRQMFEAVFKISRANPGVVLDKQHSNTYELLVVHPTKKKYWMVEHDGNIRKLTTNPR